jgi:hypothetical protein
MFVTPVTATSYRRGEDGGKVERPTAAPTKEGAMSHVTIVAHSRAYRLYDVDLPLRVPGFAVGFAISRFKQIGVWQKLPPALKDKAKEARGTWTGLKLTQKDLDSVPDDAWEMIAKALSVRWRYAAAPGGGERDGVAARG